MRVEGLPSDGRGPLVVHHVHVFVDGLVMQCPVKVEEHDLGRENDEDEVEDGRDP